MIEHFIVFGKPVISRESKNELINSLDCGWLGTGKKVTQFEKNFAMYKNAHNAVALNSCTSALFLSLKLLNVHEGDEVIAPSLTFAATVNVIEHVKATPVLVDSDLQTLNIIPEQIEAKITPKTRAIIIVHFAGRPCDMKSIMEISVKYELPVIEDCAHAIETERNGIHAGTFGDFGCFSFYANKNVTTGEGGMILSKSPEMLEKIRVLSLHGLSKDSWERFSERGYQHYSVLEPGYKFNMMDIQAAIGIHQLNDVEKNHRKREHIWNYYNESFSNLPLKLPSGEEADTVHAYHLYTPLLLDEDVSFSRDRFLIYLQKNNIGCGVHYIPVHQQPYYREKYSFKDFDFPNASYISSRTFSLPLTPYMTDDEVEAVVETVKNGFNNQPVVG